MILRSSAKAYLRFRCVRFSSANSLVNEHFLKVYQDVINDEEEKILIDYLNPILSRRRYEGNHWDDVITKYKEVDLANYKAPTPVDNIFEKIRTLIRKEISFQQDFLTPHVIDLAKDGRIGGHVDSVKFSGDFICGLSLFSSRIMRLSLDWQDTAESSLRCTVKKDDLPVSAEAERTSVYPKTVDLLLPRHSLYIMKGVWRYHYAHAVLGSKDHLDDQSLNKHTIEYDRRVSIIFRDALSE